ncbi:hypothetical protein [Streptomyces zingiberis]|uniref:Integral membrane protein n=1 Tax=Streptomyces zingiberis TaxID=2053010 RepID=A0ABX1C1E4_9ACTN|nr:hypothetical protein [Streptomyces zingiberis]NJQ01707.1 hypothetical protein [Streptomyces zingiberis]
MGHIAHSLRGWRWIGVLGALAAVCALATAVVFSPGYMSPDSLSQFEQATGRAPLSDWHPPVLSLTWRALIAVTGSYATLAVLQAVVLWGALWVIASCVWAAAGSRGGSLAVLAIGAAPQVLTFAGVIWKDVHLALALLATCAVAFTGRCLREDGRPGALRPRWGGRARWARWALLVLGVLLLSYAVLVRKNAVLAAVPVFVLLVLALWRRPGRRRWLVATAAFAAAIAVPAATVALAARPVHTSQVSQIFLDDLVHVLSVDELRSAPVSADLRGRLATAARRCKDTGAVSDAYWACYPRSPRGLSPDADELRSLWLTEMPRHLPGYLSYRLQVFTRLLFATDYRYHAGISGNDLGLKVSHPRLEDTLETYVTGSARSLPPLFAGWFWLAAALALTVRPGDGRFARPVRALGVSAAAYVLGYFPVVPIADYRYVYWPALAVTLALVLRLPALASARPRDGRAGDRAGRPDSTGGAVPGAV